MQNVELQNPMSQKPRYEFIDLAKGICIILVVHFHVCGSSNSPIDVSLCSFRMPLYFILSGLFFSQYSGIKEFIVKKTNKLLIPFIAFLILSYIADFFGAMKEGNSIFSILKHGDGLQKDGFGLNGAIWFLFCLFICGIIFYLIILLSNKLKYKLFFIVFLSLCIGACGFALGRNHINLPLWIDSAMTAIPFYAFGYIVRKYTNFLQGKYRTTYSIMLAIVFYFTTFFVGTKSSLYVNNTGNATFVIFYLCGIAGTMAILLLSKCINKIKYISYFGRYSICILLTHSLIGPCFIAQLIGHFLKKPFCLSIEISNFISFILLMILYIWIIPFMLKYMPHICAQKDLIKLNH